MPAQPALNILIATILAIGAGICFAGWPKFTQVSGMPVAHVTLLMAIVTAICALPFVLIQGWPATSPRAFGLVSSGGMVQTIGIACMVGLALVTAKNARFSDFFVLCVVVQICFAAALKYYETDLNFWHWSSYAAAAYVVIGLYKGG